ncbi:Tripeptidyl-peptidase II [Handroanthus impetiginosus]|uniref:Tripeptidyl-peptidase II n=1 Tax=Handroanthus impetiginosus TaxID=429701 RepID=A0A2G9HJY4_9LAMI|nr:Tripeptidyl-peptidase II [Handroanthus impetiginosus]
MVVEIDSTRTPSDPSSSGADTIIGILDIGIWPESESFIDEDMGPIPSHWKRKCMEGNNFTSSTWGNSCNRKMIGANYHVDPDSGMSSFGRDKSGHGTHVSSTAAGRPVAGASYYGLANGTVVGGSPASRIAIYRVCASGGCHGSAILKAFDNAMLMPDFATDTIAIRAFHAVERGIIVACSAGNSGPSSATVVNVAPWILTVAVTTIDRDFELDIVLGGNKVIKGGGITFSGLNKSAVYPLIDGDSAKSASSQHDEVDARNCIPCSLDDSKVKGKIVLQGAVGMILIDNYRRQVPSKYEATNPIVVVTEDDGAQILSYINSTSNPLATILPTMVVQNYKPAPVVADFSSRGPTYGIKNLLNPDITTLGVAILAAWPSNDKRKALPDKEPPLSIYSQAPIQIKNLHAPATTKSGLKATPYDIGAGEISLSCPLQPGLVYETETIDYIQFLCNIGYDATEIKSIALDLPKNFSCSSDSSSDSISNMNYPLIVVSKLKENESKMVSITVTNLDEEDSTYIAVVEVPTSINVQVVPNKLHFTKDVKKLLRKTCLGQLHGLVRSINL